MYNICHVSLCTPRCGRTGREIGGDGTSLMTKKLHGLPEALCPNTNYGKKTILFEGARLFSDLPEEIKKCESINMFKVKLRNMYITYVRHQHQMRMFTVFISTLYLILSEL